MSGGEFAEIEARAAAATEGPWEAEQSSDPRQMGVWFADDASGVMVAGFTTKPDAEFIAHSRTDVPALLAAVRERDNTIARVRAVLQRLHDRIVFSSKDFGEDRFDIELYGVIVGWDADDDDGFIEGHVDAWPEIQRHHPKFTDAVIAAIRADHAVIRAALDPQETP